MKIKSLLIDDDKLIATILADKLHEDHPDIEVMDIACSGTEGIEKIKLLQPELVFLDIEMPDMNGFEMLSQIKTINFQTIFTTAHSHYAIKAFKFNAIDYLLKPIIEEELAQTIRRYKSNKLKSNQNQIVNTLKNINEKNVEEQKLVLLTQKGTLQIALKHIIRIEGERNYSLIHLTDNTKELSSKSLGYFEDILTGKGFFRCHRSFLINRYHVSKIHNNGHLLLKDNTVVPISRRKKIDARNWFEQ